MGGERRLGAAATSAKPSSPPLSQSRLECVYLNPVPRASNCFCPCYLSPSQSSREEDFYDIQLNVKDIRSLRDSFRDYINVETLEGDNQYMAEGHGMQDAKKGVIFLSFPPVLHLQLKRFEYSFMYDDYYKINDRFEFPEHIDLSEFLEEGSASPATFTLQAVLVHSGTTYGGHYTAYISPQADGSWYHFDDELVYQVRITEGLGRKQREK